MAGVDVLLHDGQFTAGERRTAADYGHATVEATLRLADRAGVGRLVLTHHAPGRTDEQLDALAAQYRATPGGRPVTFARQGEPIDVAGRPAGARSCSLGPGRGGPGRAPALGASRSRRPRRRMQRRSLDHAGRLPDAEEVDLDPRLRLRRGRRAGRRRRSTPPTV